VLDAALLALGPGLLAPTLGAVELGSGARIELRAGSAPVTSGQPSVPTVALDLRGFSTAVFSSDRHTLTLRYFPRFFVRHPNDLDLTRPLFLHAGDLHHEYRAAPTLTWKNDVRASVGEVDYSSSELALASGRANPLDVAVIQFAEVEGATGLHHAFDEKTSGSATLLLGYNTPYDQIESTADDGTITIPYPAHAQAVLALEASHKSSEKTTLSLPAFVRYDGFSNDSEFAAASLSLAITHLHGALTRSELRGGAMVVKRLDTPGDDVSVFPRALAEIFTRSASSETHRFEHHAGLALEPYLDPVRAEYRLLGGVELGSLLELYPRWSAGIELAGSTSVSRHPLVPPELETYLEARTPFRYRLGDHSFFEFGTRWRARGPHLGDPPFELTDFELWGYAAFGCTLGNLSPTALY
jgi:hypothetical protein